MAEFLTMQEDKFGKKGRTNAALTLGIIGTALGAFTGNNGCGCKSEKQLLVAAGDLQRPQDYWTAEICL